MEDLKKKDGINLNTQNLLDLWKKKPWLFLTSKLFIWDVWGSLVLMRTKTGYGWSQALKIDLPSVVFFFRRAQGLPNGSLSRWSFSGGGRRRRCETNEGPVMGMGSGWSWGTGNRRNDMETEVIRMLGEERTCSDLWEGKRWLNLQAFIGCCTESCYHLTSSPLMEGPGESSKESSHCNLKTYTLVI